MATRRFVKLLLTQNQLKLLAHIFCVFDPSDDGLFDDEKIGQEELSARWRAYDQLWNKVEAELKKLKLGSVYDF